MTRSPELIRRFTTKSLELLADRLTASIVSDCADLNQVCAELAKRAKAEAA